jgi:hypothetical protein
MPQLRGNEPILGLNMILCQLQEIDISLSIR